MNDRAYCLLKGSKVGSNAMCDGRQLAGEQKEYLYAAKNKNIKGTPKMFL